ncbi:hypothetical protein [Kribbella deserti]|uniref:Uncharacterized protein n=1 Tax=Kribbella deserti TaxID=1926257 RepID=A0ABV6QL52_9ACTN
MRKVLVGLLAVVQLAVVAPGADACPDWVQVGTDINSGISGISVLSKSNGRIEALIVRDNKKPGQNRIARTTWIPGRTPVTEPLTWQGELPIDLESIDPVPGHAGEFIVVASKGKGFHILVEPGTATVLRTFQLPIGQPGDDYESFALATVGGRLTALWADRGQDERLSKLYAASFDFATLTFGPAQTVTFRAPSPTEFVRHISDLDVTADGSLVVSAAADPGDDGPFVSAVHVIGKVSAGPSLTLRPKARTMDEYDDRKIEALACLTPSCTSMLLGTDDENLGGWLLRD